MYKGKFDQKNKQDTVSVQDLLAQRNSASRQEVRKAPPAQPQQAAAAKKPQQNAPVPAKKPQPKAPAASGKPRKRGPRLGGVIFYTLYFLFILVFFLGTYLGLQWLNGWLADYEASQPTVKAQQVFDQLFTDPQWGDLYTASGAKDSPYEGKDAFVTYMDERIGDSQLTYLETSAGLSRNKKYIVRMGDEKVASFTLVDHNDVKDPSLENLEEISKIPDWQLGAVEVFFERDSSYRIVKMNGHRAFVNDVELTDDHIIQIATTKAEEYLPQGVTSGISMCTQEITNLLTVPTVTIFDDKGNQAEVTYDEATHTFTERTSSNTMAPEQEEVAIEAAKTYCLWMIKEVTDRGKVAKYFDSSSATYNSIVRTTELWMQDHNGYEFVDVKVSDFNLYNDSIFSVRISLSLDVTRTNGTVKSYPYAQSLFFQKKDNGKWLCYKATNVDVTQPVGKVRLTFMQGSSVITSDMYQTDASEIVTPLITVPEGKVFSGWVQEVEDENGQTILRLVFQPDPVSGRVAIPEGTSLEPMTLIALIEDAGADTAEGAV